MIDPFGTRTQLYATSQPASGFGALWMWVVVGLGLGAMVVGLGAPRADWSGQPSLIGQVTVHPAVGQLFPGAFRATDSGRAPLQHPEPPA